MRGSILLIVALWGPLGLAAQDVAAPAVDELGGLLQNLTPENWTTNSFADVTALVGKAQDWKTPAASLTQWLDRSYNTQAVTKPGWSAMSGLQRWCELFGENSEAVSKLDPSTVTWLLNDRALTEDFFAILSPQDKVPQALTILEDLHKSDAARFPAYDRLAIAMAIVWDVPPPASPHHQVDPIKIPPDTSTTPERFRFWVDCNEKKVCDFDLTKLEVEQLKFIVDASQPLDELRWAQAAVRYSLSNFDQAFSSIRYDEPRLDQGVFSWPHPTYTLKEIRKLGGICVDQAYFASVAGKANGIPTLFFTGEGRRGGHAWFGYMKSPDRWNVDCGRYQYDKYATGTATDPQTNKPISDHEIAFMAELFHNSPEYRASMAHLRQASLFDSGGDATRALAAIEAAIKISPLNVDAWEFKTSLLEKDATAVDACKAHLNTMANQFVRYPDIKAACLQKVATLSREGGDSKAADQVEDRIIRENRGKRHDLSAEVYSKKIDQCCENGDWKGGREAVHDAISKLKDEKGVVMELMQKFVTKCVENGQYDEASRTLADFKNKVRPGGREGAQVEALQKMIKEAIKAQKGGKK